MHAKGNTVNGTVRTIATKLLEKQATRSIGEKLLAWQGLQTLYVQCQYFVLPEEPTAAGGIYLGFAAVPAGKKQNIPFDTEHFRFEPLHTASRTDVGFTGGDGVAVACVTLRRTAGNRLRIWTAPNRVGKGMNLRTVQYSGPAMYLYELQANGKSVGTPLKINDRPQYIRLDTSYLLTDENRSFTLKFICSGHCFWQLPVT